VDDGSMPAPSALPEYLTKSRLLRKKKIGKSQLSGFTEQMMLLHAPESQRLFWKALIEGLSIGDKEAMRMAADIFKLIQKGGGMTVVQQMYSATSTVSSEGTQIQGFDQFVRSVHEARTGAKMLPPPADDVRVSDVFNLTPIAEVVDVR